MSPRRSHSHPRQGRRCARIAPLLALAFLSATFVEAIHARPHRAEVSAFSGYRLGGDFRDRGTGDTLGLDGGTPYGLVIDIPYRTDSQIELLWSHAHQGLGRATALPSDPFVDLNVDYIHVGGLYLPRGEPFRPFVTASVGVTHMDPLTPGYESATRVSFGLGAGLKWWLTRHLGLRLEARGFMTLLDSGGAIFCGPNGCIARISGTGLGQLETTAGLVVAF